MDYPHPSIGADDVPDQQKPAARRAAQQFFAASVLFCLVALIRPEVMVWLTVAQIALLAQGLLGHLRWHG